MMYGISRFVQRLDIVLLLGIPISVVLISCPPYILADDNNIIAIPTTTSEINLDGDVVVNEWNGARNITFPGARSDEQNVTIYLRYESNNRVLSGAFEIPGRSSVPPQSDSNEGIHFLFETINSTNEYLDENDHDIALYRDKI